MTSSQRDIPDFDYVATTEGPLKIISKDEMSEALDALARRYVNMSGEEFIEAWESGKYDDQREFEGLMRMVLMIPFVK